MFDADTASLLRSAPAVPELDPNDIPALLTAAYARLASSRLAQANPTRRTEIGPGWNLERLADTYEIIVSLTLDNEQRRPAAFVSATAQQIIARIEASEEPSASALIDRDRLDPSLAAALLFLISSQYADANEAVQGIRQVDSSMPVEVRSLSLAIQDLARGRLAPILERAPTWRNPVSDRALEDAALFALLEALITGIELLASELLNVEPPETSTGRFTTSQEAFSLVVQLSTSEISTGIDGQTATVAYAGPAHLARLLQAAGEQLAPASLLRVPPPHGANSNKWQKWLRSRSKVTPYVWPNHMKAIEKGFYDTGVSAVLVLPTGAGKTTVSSLKIAGKLASEKKVIFLAPTHALVDQLVGDLQEMFPPEIMGSVISSDYDLLLLSGAQLRDIEVMTPERCLAMLSFAPEAFADVGLLVFDECHLLSPEPGRSRRAIDAMLCVLAFHRLVPDADMLFLSAMVKNPEELAEWVEMLTERPCIQIDLLWKPSR